jgi:nucleolar protein 56
MVPGRVPRRTLLRTLGGVGLASVAGCTTPDASPTFEVPSTALTDESIRIVVDGLVGETVTVRAETRSRGGQPWAARGRFEVGDDGRLAVPSEAPVGGRYEAVDSMGLFWSMRPTDAPVGQPLPPSAVFRPGEAYDVALTAHVDGEPVAETTTTRRMFDPDIERRPVDADDLVGTVFLPPGDGPAPPVVHLHGAGGRPHTPTGRLLASRGFAALTLQYFGDPEPLPDTLAEVPVEYVHRAIAWLRAQPRVDGPDVGLFGFSRGGELALLAGSLTADAGAIVGWVPSGVVWEGLTYGRSPAGTSAWSVGGDPVPFLNMAQADLGPPPTPALPLFAPALAAASEAELASASIPVERATAPIYLVSATDDRRWPSTALAGHAVDRLAANAYAHRYRHDSHAGAGHYLTLPYLPTAGTTRDARNVYGGSQEANARASSRAWNESLSFLDESLGG